MTATMAHSRRDPTRSAGLRRQGRTVVTRKVHQLHSELRQNLQDHDVVGLRQKASLPAGFSMFVEGNSSRLDRSDMMLNRVVEQSLESPPDWLSGLIDRAVQRGLEQVGQELKTEIDGLDYADVSRFHGNLATIEVHGIAGETHRRVMRHVFGALERDSSPELLMREIRATLEKITKLRLNMLVNTSVVRAVNAGKLFGYAENGVRQVGIDPEWLPPRMTHDHRVLHDKEPPRPVTRPMFSGRTQQRRERVERTLEAAFAGKQVEVLTAGDDKVCDECDDIAAGGPYDLDSARDKIPAHPNCRCAFIPYGDKRYAAIEEQDDDE
jgi:hypothetical protein